MAQLSGLEGKAGKGHEDNLCPLGREGCPGWLVGQEWPVPKGPQDQETWPQVLVSEDIHQVALRR